MHQQDGTRTPDVQHLLAIESPSHTWEALLCLTLLPFVIRTEAMAPPLYTAPPEPPAAVQLARELRSSTCRLEMLPWMENRKPAGNGGQVGNEVVMEWSGCRPAGTRV